jgi:DNA polymerase-1
MSWNVHLPDAEWFSPRPPAAIAGTPAAADWKFDLEPVIRELLDVPLVALDTETTGLNTVKDTPFYWSMSWTDYTGRDRRVCMPSDTISYFQNVFKDANKRWVFANAKYDMHILANVGIHLVGECCDTQTMHALLYEEQRHGLKDMAREVLGWKWTDFKETFGILKGMSIQDALVWMEHNNLDKLVEYASNDAYGTLKIYHAMKKELEEAKTYSFYEHEFTTMADIFFKTEMPYTRVLWKLERNGIKVNAKYLESISGPADLELEKIQREIVKHAGRMLNPNSPLQLRQYFIEELKLRPLTYTKGGKTGVKAPSVDYDFLYHYRNEVPVAKLMLDFRELDKLKGTYINGLRERMDPNDRIHTRFNQDVARTGRLSSSDPNLQNIPTSENDKFKLRNAFIPCDEDHELIVVDYEALEMRLLASATVGTKGNPDGARDMIQIFLDKKDIHMGNAALMMGKRHGVTYEEIVAAKKMDKLVKEGKEPETKFTPRMLQCLKWRAQIKNVAFGLNYGMKENKLARDLNIPKEEALELMEGYMDTHPAVRAFFQEAVEETEKTGFSYTYIGRRRFHPEIASNRDMERFEAQRKAVNNNIQGTAADVVRFAMLQLDAECLDYHYGCKMLLQVHDELVFECPKSTVAAVKPIIKRVMEHPFILDMAVPLTVSMGSGDSWLSAK